MSEEEDPIRLDEEEVQDIIEWALSAGAMITLMHSAPLAQNVEEIAEKLNGYIEAVQIMYENIPDILVTPTHDLAVKTIESVEREDALVEQFRKEIDDNL